MPARDFTELTVYQRAFDSAFEIFELTRRFPPEERYALTDQVRRSSRSICANIAEAWRKRRYPASFVSKLSDADAEAAETQVWLDMALRCGYLDAERHAELADRYRHINAQLARMMAQADLWCSTPADSRDQR
ncbi:MAG TPA: four helix bundle protein [Thermomicrobiales bacterium]|nr:four helix bundle protein [Thermomicrobiales bacterium]